MKEFKSIDDILEYAIDSEQEAVDFYSLLANEAKNQEMKEVFTQFAGEEMNHKARLMRIKETGAYTIKHNEVKDLKISDYIIDVAPRPDMSYQDALVVAMKKEKAAFKLYTDLAKKAPNQEMADLFQSLAQEESKHKLRFEIEYDDFVLKDN